MHTTDLPELLPKPQEMERGNGSFPPPRRVSVVASAGKPVVEKILERAGISTGEGGYPVDCRIEKSSGAPSTSKEYYELEVQERGTLIRAPKLDGIFRAAQTLTGVLRSAASGGKMAELAIRDWPDMANRGIFVENKWGPDRMSREEWFLLVDRLVNLKMNRLGIGLYGCWGNCRFEAGPHGDGRPTEFLMVPVPGHPELASEKRLRWYSPHDGVEHDERYLPRIFEEDFLGDVVAYAKERSVTVIPFINSLGHNTLIPRLIPGISAKDEQGTPLGIGYCLSNPETRRFIEDFYGSVIERYFPDGADLFHIQMDEILADNPDPDAPLRREEPWCRCEVCRRHTHEENLQEYIIWLVETLVEKGVGKVVLWNDQLTRHMDALDETFLGKLKERDLDRRLILHWWWYSNEALNDRTRVSIGGDLGLSGWVAPMTCYYNWQMYSPRMKNVELMLDMAHSEGGEGAVAYSVHDPAWSDHEMLEACNAWNYEGTEPWEDQEKRWAESRFGAGADRYLKAMELLRSAAATGALAHCYHYPYTYVREGLPWPRSYPGEAMEALADIAGAEAELSAAVRQAHEAGEVFAALVGEQRLPEEKAILRSLHGEAARIEGLAESFIALLVIRRAATEDRLEQGDVERCERATDTLTRCMAIVETEKPAWIVPAALQSLSVLRTFLIQLHGDLLARAAGDISNNKLRWSIAKEFSS